MIQSSIGMESKECTCHLSVAPFLVLIEVSILLYHRTREKELKRIPIDFAIAGFSKFGTTTMMNRLNENPQVQPVGERHELRNPKKFDNCFRRYTLWKR